MVQERPSRDELDGAARLLASARSRLFATAEDLAIPTGLRLTEWQRATLAALADALLSSIEDELRSALSERLSGAEAAQAALSSVRVAIALPILGSSGTLRAPALISSLLRRAEEHRLQRGAPGDQGLLLDLAGDADPAVAGEAMALLVAQSGRVDPFHEPLIARTDLPAELEHGLVWAVAAALRTYLTAQHGIGSAAADEAVIASAGALLGRYDEGDTFDARCFRLARALDRAGRLDGAMIARTLAEAHLSLFLAAVALRTGLTVDAAWELVSEPTGRGTILLLKAAGASREEAAAIFLALQYPEQRLRERLDDFDSVSAEAEARLLALWRAHPGYRAALAELIQ
jgi:hypothetical protein